MRAEAEAFQLPKQPDPGKAMVYVVRPSGIGTFVRFNVFLDSKAEAAEMGYTRGGQYIYFQVAPGDHLIYSKAENWALVHISPKAGDVVYIEQSPELGLLMARNSVGPLDDVQGRLDVKQSSPGTSIRNDGSEGGGSPGPALSETEMSMSDWKKIRADENVKVYAKTGVYSGKLISYDVDYLWISVSGGGKKAFAPTEIDKLSVVR